MNGAYKIKVGDKTKIIIQQIEQNVEVTAIDKKAGTVDVKIDFLGFPLIVPVKIEDVISSINIKNIYLENYI